MNELDDALMARGVDEGRVAGGPGVVLVQRDIPDRPCCPALPATGLQPVGVHRPGDLARCEARLDGVHDPVDERSALGAENAAGDGRLPFTTVVSTR